MTSQMLKAFAGIDDRTHCVSTERYTDGTFGMAFCRCGKTFSKMDTALEHVDAVGVYGPAKLCSVTECNREVPGTYSDVHCDEHWYDMEIVE